MDNPTPSPISISSKWTPDEAEKLLDLIKERTGARSVLIFMLDTDLPCAEEKTTGRCEIGHRNALRGDVPPATMHEMFVQLLHECPGHRRYLHPSLRKDL
jgi:hypothetical protein